MFTQILTAALIFGTLILIIKVFRNCYLGKSYEFGILTLFSYILVSVPCFAFVLLGGANYIGDNQAHTCVAAISLFTPVILEFLLHRLAEKVLNPNRSGQSIKKPETA